jgi:uncharacterized protein YwgA
MNELLRSAILLSLIEHMNHRGSWCGETHVQKSAFVLQDLMHVPLNFDFILYKYGPYSFGLSDEIVAMRADSLLSLTPAAVPYGPKLAPGELTEQLKRRFPKTLEKLTPKIDYVAEKLGNKNVTELEALTTLLFVHLKEHVTDPDLKIKRLQELKPHIKDELARKSSDELDALIRESAQEWPDAL